jgi:lysozyme
MQISQEGVSLIKKYEGLRLRAYLCPAGVWTIGYGTTGPHIKQGMVITTSEAESFLEDDLNKFGSGVLSACAAAVPNQHEFDAMVCFAYNVGLANFKGSHVLSYFKSGNKEAAANAFMLWTKAHDPKTHQLVVLPGLVKRRNDERTLFLSGGLDTTVPRPVSNVRAVEVPEASVVPVAPKPLSKSREIIGGSVVGLGGVGQLISGLTADDATVIKKSTTELQTDSNNSHLFKTMHLPEIAAAMTVTLSLFIVWKRFSDRKSGVR